MATGEILPVRAKRRESRAIKQRSKNYQSSLHQALRFKKSRNATARKSASTERAIRMCPWRVPSHVRSLTKRTQRKQTLSYETSNFAHFRPTQRTCVFPISVNMSLNKIHASKDQSFAEMAHSTIQRVFQRNFARSFPHFANLVLCEAPSTALAVLIGGYLLPDHVKL